MLCNSHRGPQIAKYDPELCTILYSIDLVFIHACPVQSRPTGHREAKAIDHNKLTLDHTKINRKMLAVHSTNIYGNQELTCSSSYVEN